MKVAIRADASRRIGTGHVMRCLALAGALRDRGVEVHFICRELDGHLAGRIRSQEHPLHLLPAPGGAPLGATGGPPHADWLEVPPEVDAGETDAVLETLGPVDWLIVDHYALEARWHRALRGRARQLLAIDDVADRDFDADAVLDPLPQGPERYAPRVPPHCRLWLGPEYALLRPEFAAVREHAPGHSGTLRRLFVAFGGVDPTGETARVLEALALLGGEAPATDVVIGHIDPRSDALRSQAARLPQVRLHEGAPNVAELMANADLAIGAAGGMLWERCSVGLPALVVVVADNQAPGAKTLVAAGAAEALAAGTEPAEIAERLRALAATPLRLRTMSERARALTDGRGAARIARLLCPPPLQLRRATVADSAALLRWRNDESVRRHSNDSALIGLPDHERWLAGVLPDPRRLLLIAEHEERPVGVVRYDVSGAEARVSIYLVPGAGGHGYGPAILGAGTARLVQEQPAVRRIAAEIHPDNRASLRAFREAGYRLEGSLHRLHLPSA